MRQIDHRLLDDAGMWPLCRKDERKIKFIYKAKFFILYFVVNIPQTAAHKLGLIHNSLKGFWMGFYDGGAYIIVGMVRGDRLTSGVVKKTV